MKKSLKPDYKPQVGDIIFSRKHGFLSWSIRFIMGPFPYSHLCLVGEKLDGKTIVYTTGVNVGPTSPRGVFSSSVFRSEDMAAYLANKSYVICRYQGEKGKHLTPPQKQAILEFCHKQLGKKFPFRKSLKLFRQTIRGVGVNRVTDKKSRGLFDCYEAVVRAYRAAGITFNKRLGNIDPSGYDIKEIYLSPVLVDIFAKTRR